MSSTQRRILMRRKRTAPTAPKANEPPARPKKLMRQVSSLEHHTPLEKIVDALHCEAVYNFYVAHVDEDHQYVLLFEKKPIRRAPGFGWLDCVTVGSDLFNMPAWTVAGGLTPQYDTLFQGLQKRYLNGANSERAPEDYDEEELESEAQVVTDTIEQFLEKRNLRENLLWADTCNEVRRAPGSYTSKDGRQTVIRLASFGGELAAPDLPEILKGITADIEERRANDDTVDYMRAVWVTIDSFMEAVEETASQIRTEAGQSRLQLPKSSLCWAEDHWGRYLRIALAPELVLPIMNEFQTHAEIRSFLLASVPGQQHHHHAEEKEEEKEKEKKV